MQSTKQSQLDKFKQAARELGANDADAYEAAVKKIAKAPKLSAEQVKKLAKQAKRPPFDNGPSRWQRRGRAAY